LIGGGDRRPIRHARAVTDDVVAITRGPIDRLRFGGCRCRHSTSRCGRPKAVPQPRGYPKPRVESDHAERGRVQSDHWRRQGQRIPRLEGQCACSDHRRRKCRGGKRRYPGEDACEDRQRLSLADDEEPPSRRRASRRKRRSVGRGQRNVTTWRGRSSGAARSRVTPRRPRRRTRARGPDRDRAPAVGCGARAAVPVGGYGAGDHHEHRDRNRDPETTLHGCPATLCRLARAASTTSARDPSRALSGCELPLHAALQDRDIRTAPRDITRPRVFSLRIVVRLRGVTKRCN
jgi:hypothetical protein